MGSQYIHTYKKYTLTSNFINNNGTPVHLCSYPVRSMLVQWARPLIPILSWLDWNLMCSSAVVSRPPHGLSCCASGDVFLFTSLVGSGYSSYRFGRAHLTSLINKDSQHQGTATHWVVFLFHGCRWARRHERLIQQSDVPEGKAVLESWGVGTNGPVKPARWQTVQTDDDRSECELWRCW